MEYNTLTFNTEQNKYSNTLIVCEKRNNCNAESIIDNANEIKQRIINLYNDIDGSYLFEIINLIKKFIIEYRVTEETKHHMFDIIDTIWNNDINHKHTNCNDCICDCDHDRQTNQFKRCIFGTLVRAVTDIYKMDTPTYDQDHMIIISYLFDKIINYNHRSDDKLCQINNYLICIESNIDDSFLDGYKYLVRDYNFNYPVMDGDVIKILLSKIIDSYLTSKENHLMCQSYQSIVQHIENLLKHINLRNIDDIFNRDVPFDRSLLAENTENIFDALTPIAKMTVIGSTVAVSLMLQTSGDFDTLDNLIAIAQRYKNIDCLELLKSISSKRSMKYLNDDKQQQRENYIDDESDDCSNDGSDDNYIDIFLACMSIRIHLINDDIDTNMCSIL
jgi:hypothetical protein